MTPVPPAPDRSVPRPRLTSALGEALRRPVALVRAPAGFGKTTAVAQWARRRGMTCAWVCCTEADADAGRFWEDVHAELDRLDGKAPSGPRGAKEAAARLAAAGRGAVLVLDDYQRIGGDSPVNDQLAGCIARLPENAHIVVASRGMPRLGLPRLRLDDAVLELSEDDLRFTRLETRELFARAGIALNEEQLGRICDAADGWPAALRMVLAAWPAAGATGADAAAGADAADAAAGADAAGAALTACEPALFEYAREELLAPVGPDVRTLVATMAHFGSFDEELACAVLGWDARQAARQAAAACDGGLAARTAPAPGNVPAYTLNPLLARCLSARAAALGAPTPQDAFRRASSHYEQRHHFDSAVEAAARARDWDHVARLIERRWRALFAADSLDVLAGWFALLPRGYISDSPRLCSLQALPLATVGQRRQALRRLDQARRGLPADGPQRAEHLAIECLTCSMLGEVPAAHDAGEAALRALPETETYLRAMVQQALAGIEIFSNPLRARARFEESLGALELLAMENPLCSAYANLAHICSYLGDLDAAVTYAQKADEVFDEGAGTASGAGRAATTPAGEGPAKPMLALSQLACARVAYARDDVAGARRALRRLRRVAGKSAMDSTLAVMHIIEALVARLEGNADKELQLVARADRISPAAVACSFAPLSRLGAWADAGVFDAQKAAELLADRYPDSPCYEVFRLSLACATGRADGRAGADAGARALDAASACAHMPSFRIRALVTAALLFERAGEPARAQDAVAQAASCAESIGNARAFLDEDELVPVLRRAARADKDSYAADLLKRLSSRAAPAAPAPAAAALTPREMEVIRLAADGLSVHQIAERLFVSDETAKKHLGNVYGKLGVHGKMQAVALLRRLGAL